MLIISTGQSRVRRLKPGNPAATCNGIRKRWIPTSVSTEEESDDEAEYGEVEQLIRQMKSKVSKVKDKEKNLRMHTGFSSNDHMSVFDITDRIIALISM